MKTNNKCVVVRFNTKTGICTANVRKWSFETGYTYTARHQYGGRKIIDKIHTVKKDEVNRYGDFVFVVIEYSSLFVDPDISGAIKLIKKYLKKRYHKELSKLDKQVEMCEYRLSSLESVTCELVKKVDGTITHSFYY